MGAVVGGWTLDATTLSGTNAILKSAGVLSLGTGTDAYNTAGRIYIDGPNNRFSIGDALTFDGTDLSLTGTVYATAGSFTGNVSAGSGNIGNWNIVAGELAYGTDIVLDATNRAIYIKDSTFGNDGIQMEYNSGTPRFYVGDGATKYLQFDGTDVSIGGNIYALGGTIGGFTIGTNTLTTTGFTIGDSTQPYALNASNLFTVTHAGALVASSATISGDITAVNINSDSGSIGG